jgi:hypothetical protein
VTPEQNQAVERCTKAILQHMGHSEANWSASPKKDLAEKIVVCLIELGPLPIESSGAR